MALICDTGPLYAAMDRADADHEACARLLIETDEELVVPAPVLVELDWLASSRLGHRPFSAFLADVEDGAVTVVELERRELPRVRELLDQYADLSLGFVDAAVVVVTERLGERKLASLDRHLGTVRPRHVAALELLPV